jgi:hypothetical protein
VARFAGAVASAAPVAEIEAVEAERQPRELTIYSGRQGQLDFYTNKASPAYLGWPPTAAAPFSLGWARMAGHAHEKIDTVFTGFTPSGTTAAIYYTDHRTMTSDGKPVHQTFENMHFWSRRVAS